MDPQTTQLSLQHSGDGNRIYQKKMYSTATAALKRTVAKIKW